jgi:hypothetical protein
MIDDSFIRFPKYSTVVSRQRWEARPLDFQNGEVRMRNFSIRSLLSYGMKRTLSVSEFD